MCPPAVDSARAFAGSCAPRTARDTGCVSQWQRTRQRCAPTRTLIRLRSGDSSMSALLAVVGCADAPSEPSLRCSFCCGCSLPIRLRAARTRPAPRRVRATGAAAPPCRGVVAKWTRRGGCGCDCGGALRPTEAFGTVFKGAWVRRLPDGRSTPRSRHPCGRAVVSGPAVGAATPAGLAPNKSAAHCGATLPRLQRRYGCSLAAITTL